MNNLAAQFNPLRVRLTLHTAHLRPGRALINARSRWRIVGILIAMLSSLTLHGCGGGDSSSVGTPTQSTITVRSEAVVLSGLNPASLRLPVATIQSVYGYTDTGDRIDFAAGQDWQVSHAGLVRTATSRLPDFAGYRYTASSGTSFEFSPDPRNPALLIPFQVYVDYRSTRADRLLTPTAGAARPGSVVCLGDSIAAGAHTIASFFTHSDADSWCGLLRKHLGAAAQVLNPSVAGGTLASVLPDLPALTASRPQLVILAFGMNDHTQGAAGLDTFEFDLTGAVRSLQATGIRVILLGFFQQNTRWVREDTAQTAAYNAVIARVALRQAVPFVDVRRAFERSAPDGNVIEARTGDFIHHPNSYGHRVYFSLLLPHVLAAPVWASEVPDAVDLAD